jgi:hypothetical protein
MPTTEVERTVELQTPRTVKCPTPQCPGWITLDSTRHQTEPCRYCRIGVDTLRFLLSRVGADNKALPAQVHDEFNRLMLTMAGAWGQNVYLRPSRETLVDLRAGQRGVMVEYNPQLGAAGEDGAAPLVGIILHKLLHFEAHLGHRMPQISAKSGARERDGMLPLMGYLFTLADHAWVTARLRQLNPMLHEAQSRWGLDLAQMLVGSESMFNRYLSQRNLDKLLAVLQETESAQTFRAAVIARLAALTQQILEREREETRKTYLAIQLGNVRLLNPDAYPTYESALTKTELDNLRDAIPVAERLIADLQESPLSTPPQAKEGEITKADPVQYHKAIEGSIKALGLGNYFEVKS